MEDYNFVGEIVEKYNISPQMVSSIGIDILKFLHEIAYKEHMGLAMMYTQFNIGEEACYHLGGIVSKCYSNGDELCVDQDLGVG